MATAPVNNSGMWNAATTAASNAYQSLPSAATVGEGISSLTSKVVEFVSTYFSQVSSLVETNQKEVLTAVVVILTAVAAYKAVQTVYSRIFCC